MKKQRFTPELIEQLNENEVFVFGSNKAGNHAGGAARTAVEKFGAVMGHGEGIQGQSYAIPTIDENMEKVPLDDLQQSLFRFCQYAEKESEKTFYLTKIGMGIAGFTLDEMLEVINRVDLPSNVIIPEEFNVVYGYKGFEEDLTCRGYQYEIGGDYEEESVAACYTGFHFCRNPFDVLGYYPPHDSGMRRYCTVKGSGRFDKSESDKVASTKLHVEAEIGLAGLIKAGVKFIFDRVNWRDNKESNTGDYSAAEVSGEESVAIVTGKNCKARGAIGNWIVLTERDEWDGNTYPIIEVKAFKVDGETVKENVWYKLVYGNITEA